MDSPTSQRVFITGITGFTGRHLAHELEAAGFEVLGSSSETEDPERGIFKLDLCDQSGLSRLLHALRPDYVLHLAAITFVAHEDADAIYRTNIVGTRNLLAALTASPKIPEAVILASSANIYGNVASSPIVESSPAQPANDYAVSKLAMEAMASLWQDRLPLIITRPFNYTGVGQSEQFLLPKIVAHFRRKAPVIELGNLDVARDFSDVRKVARAYLRLLQTRPLGETFNICSGVAHNLSEIIEMMQTIAGYEIDVRVNPRFVRANEIRELTGSPEKLRQAIGPLPEFALKDCLQWMYQA